jgi:Spy/CpxP family protein refolding chaperone
MTKAATPDTSKIETQINQMEKRLDQALGLAMQPAQLDMTVLI